MGNRVEDLETQVAELQAAVDGLTEELVETKERLSQLEAATDVRGGESSADSHAEFVPNASATPEAEEMGADRTETPTEEAPESGGADGETDDENGEAEESDDIIVA